MGTWNYLLTEKLNEWAYLSPSFTSTIEWIADRLDVWVIVFLLAWFLRRAWKRHWSHACHEGIWCVHEMMMTLVTGGVAWLAANGLKMIFRTPRPFLVTELDITPIFFYGGINAFPSGHAALFMALAVTTWFHDRAAGVLVMFCALLIGVARVMAGVHFPIDIIGGYCIGVFLSLAIMFFDRQHVTRT